MDLNEAQGLVAANEARGDISVTSRLIPDFVGKKDCSYYEIILTLRTPSDSVSALGTLAATSGKDESERRTLIRSWESALGLYQGGLLDYDDLLEHIRAKNARKK